MRISVGWHGEVLATAKPRTRTRARLAAFFYVLSSANRSVKSTTSRTDQPGICWIGKVKRSCALAIRNATFSSVKHSLGLPCARRG